jgi:tetratricopeptide (TPR) repeat protein
VKQHLQFFLLIIFLFIFLSCSEGGRTQYNQAKRLQDKGMLEEAINEYEKMIKEHKRGKWVELACEQVEICKALLIYQNAERALSDKEIEKARDYLMRANKKHRIEHKALYIEGRIYIAEGRLDRAEVIFLDLINDYPALSEGHLGLAMLEEQQGKYGSAILNYGKVIRFTEDIVMKEEAIKGLERIVEKDDSGKHLGLLEEQLDYFKGTPLLLYKAGKYCIYQKREPEYNKAISYFNRALSFEDEIDNNFKVLIYKEMAIAYERGGSTSPAIRNIKKALEIDPENKELLTILDRLKNSSPE